MNKVLVNESNSILVVGHGLCYTVEFSVVFVTFILCFDFLFQFYEGNLLVEAIIVFIPSSGVNTILNIAALIVSSFHIISESKARLGVNYNPHYICITMPAKDNEN